VASGGADQLVRLWERSGQPAPGPQIPQLRSIITSLGISADGRTIAAGDRDFGVFAWRDRTPIDLPKFGPELHDPLVAISGDGETIVSTIGRRRVGGLAAWNAKWPELRILAGSELNNEALALAVSRNGSTIAVGYRSGEVRLWNADGAQIGGPLLGDGLGVYSVAVSPDGQTIVAGNGALPPTVRLWDREGSPLGLPLEGHGRLVTSVAISVDGQTIVSGGWDGTVRLWELGDDQLWLDAVCEWLETYRPPARLEKDAEEARAVSEALQSYRDR